MKHPILKRLGLPRAALLLGVALCVLIGLLAGRAPQAALSDDVNNVKQGTIQPLHTPAGQEAATFAAGCFWAREAIFGQLKGVTSIQSGYAGGHTKNPSYEQVCTGTTGHAETVQIFFDPKVISYRDLLDVYFHTADPTTVNQQGPDSGTQYRSVIFYHSPAQREAARREIQALTKARAFSDPIVTEVVPYTNFYAAEQYHNNYFALHPDEGYCQMVVAPEVAHFKELYRSKLK